jgi:hypothetical protein
MCQCNNYCPCCGQPKQGYSQYGYPYKYYTYPGGAGGGGVWGGPTHTTTDGLGQKYDQFGNPVYA